MADLVHEILNGIVNFVRENSHLADPPYKVLYVCDVMHSTVTPKVTTSYAVEVTTAPLSDLNEKTATVIWIEPPLVYFADRDIHWPIDDPNIDLGKIALIILEDSHKLHATAADAARGRSLTEMASHIKGRADMLKNELVSHCNQASSDLHKQLENDPNVQTVGFTEGAAVEEIIIYTFTKAKEGTYPTEFKGFKVHVRKLGPLSTSGD